MTERVLALPVLAALGHLFQGERQGGACTKSNDTVIQKQAQQIILLCLFTVLRGLLIYFFIICCAQASIQKMLPA